MNALPKISIVTASLNQGNFIEDTIISVVNQSYDNFEYIICDGVSTDNTLQVIDRYSNYNIKVISEPDSGQSNAINKGLRMATGDIVAWLNSDDFYINDKVLFKIANIFNSHNDIDLVYGDDIIIDGNNNLLFYRKYFDFNFGAFLLFNTISQPTVFMRRSVIEKHLLKEDLNYVMDYEMWLRLHLNGYKFMYINDIVSCNRIHFNRKMLKGKESAATELNLVRTNYGYGKYNNKTIITKLATKFFDIYCRLYGITGISRAIDSIESSATNLHHTGKLNAMFSQLTKRDLTNFYKNNSQTTT